MSIPNSSSWFRLFIANNYLFVGTVYYEAWRRPLSELLEYKTSARKHHQIFIMQNYPNPFNPITNVKFSIVNSGDVKLVVYDVMGREVQTLVNESLQPGTYETSFDGSALNSGVYFYKLITDGFTRDKKNVVN